MRARWTALVGVSLLAVCGSGSDGAPAASSGASTPSATASATSSAAPVGLRERCGAAAEQARRVSVPAGPASLSAAEQGAGSTVAVLLHQTNGDGLCGWASGAKLLAQHGIRTVSVDLCGYGESTCELPAATQVKAAVSWARGNGARRVVVIGASMGGSIALGTARTSGADAVVDLSGPTSWSDVPDAATAAKGLATPLLVAASKDDTDTDAAALRAATATASGPHRFVQTPEGHGWDLVSTFRDGADRPTAFFPTLVSWTKGTYAGG